MEMKREKALMIMGAAAALIVIAAVVGALLIDINFFKPRLETAASEATGLDVMINGKIGISFFPFGVSANDIRVSGRKGGILSLKKLKIGVEICPLLKKQLKITRCELVNPELTIVKEGDGKYNFENTENKIAEMRLRETFSLKEFIISQGVLIYLDRKTGGKIEFKEIVLAVKDVSIADSPGNIVRNLSFTGNLDCREVRNKDLKIDNIKTPVKMEKGAIYLAPLTMDIFNAKAEGDVTADKSEIDTVYRVNFKVPGLNLEKLQASFGTKKVIGGKGDLDFSLVIKEKKSRDLVGGVNGSFSLRGDNLILYTMDLDKVLSSYESSRQFNLIDIGAFFIAGPLGTFALKGYDYGDIYHQTRGGQSVITQLISAWQIKDGLAEAKDCALATYHNRIAFKGRLNLVTERYEHVTVALLDEKGCAKFEQRIAGSFDNPEVDTLSVVESLGGPISDLFKKAKRFIQGSGCEVFYNGSVRQP